MKWFIFIFFAIFVSIFLFKAEQRSNSALVKPRVVAASVADVEVSGAKVRTANGSWGTETAVALISSKYQRDYPHNLSVIASYCAPYLFGPPHKADIALKDRKVAAWCAGIRHKIGEVQAYAAVEANDSAGEWSPVQSGVAKLYAKGGDASAGNDAIGLLAFASSPQDYASVAQAIDTFYPAKLWNSSGLDRRDVKDPEILARFSGLLAGCELSYCGGGSTATLDLCSWPGNACKADSDFNEALANNFSRADIERMQALAQGLVALDASKHVN